MQDQTQPAIAVPLSLAQAVFAYLSGRPWSEVNQMIAALQACQPVADTAVPE